MTKNVPARLIEFSDQRKNNLDFLRFLFVSLVILSHSFVLTNPSVTEPLSRLSSGKLSLGALSVDAFFVISGFLITASLERSKTLLCFLWKRVLRIYPGFIVCCLVCAWVVGPLAAPNPRHYFAVFPWGHFIKDALLLNKLALPDTFLASRVPSQVNGSLWSIKIEFECYLLCALLGIVGLLKRRKIVLFLLCITNVLFLLVNLPFVMAQVPFAHHFLHLAEHFRFGTFFLFGAAFFLYRNAVPFSSKACGCALLLLAASLTSSVLLCVLLPVALTYLVFYVGFHPRICCQQFSVRGDLSYGVYLYGWPTQQLLVLFVLGRNASPYLLTLVALPVACVVAALSWHFVERPCLSLKHKKSTQDAVRGTNLLHLSRTVVE